MKILYAGYLSIGSTARHRMEALMSLGLDVEGIDVTEPPGFFTLGFRIQNRLGLPPDLAGANAKIRESVARAAPDVLWIDKGRTIHASTLRAVRGAHPACVFVSYSPDDMMYARNQSHFWRRAVPLYDLHVTTKTFNLPELPTIGARRVLFVLNGYDPVSHRPIPLADDERARWACDTAFVGVFEEERFEMMLALARAGLPVRIYGPNWRGREGAHPGLDIRPEEVKGDDYARALSGARISLCFLRKKSRDLQTTRTMEIPACGSFMLGERTSEHLDLFEEGREAEFFGSVEELIDKTRYYLAHEDERRRIAQAGRERLLRSGYSNRDHMAKVLDEVRRIRTAAGASALRGGPA